MNRRSFIKRIALIAGSVAIGNIPTVESAPEFAIIEKSVSVSGPKAMTADMLSEQLKKIYGEKVVELFSKKSMVYDAFIENKRRGDL